MSYPLTLTYSHALVPEPTSNAGLLEINSGMAAFVYTFCRDANI